MRPSISLKKTKKPEARKAKNNNNESRKNKTKSKQTAEENETMRRKNRPGENRVLWWVGHRVRPCKLAFGHRSRTVLGTVEYTGLAFSPAPSLVGSWWRSRRRRRPCRTRNICFASDSPISFRCSSTGCGRTCSKPGPSSRWRKRCRRRPSRTSARLRARDGLSPTRSARSESRTGGPAGSCTRTSRCRRRSSPEEDSDPPLPPPPPRFLSSYSSSPFGLARLSLAFPRAWTRA